MATDKVEVHQETEAHTDVTMVAFADLEAELGFARIDVVCGPVLPNGRVDRTKATTRTYRCPRPLPTAKLPDGSVGVVNQSRIAARLTSRIMSAQDWATTPEELMRKVNDGLDQPFEFVSEQGPNDLW